MVGTLWRMSSWDALDAVMTAACEQDGVLSRAQARSLGMDRWAVANQVQAGRWRVYGDQAIAVHPMPLSFRARCRVSVWQAGRNAVLDGSSALTWHGLANFEDGIHVIIPWPGKARRWDGSVVHPTRLWNAEDFTYRAGLRTTRPDVAAIRSAMWARSNRAGATVMAMAVQQRLTTGDAVLLEAKRLNRHKRRELLLQVAKDIADGAQALSELDFAVFCRKRGFPKPTKQRIRRGKDGHVYLDVIWEDLRVVVEIDGIHHAAAESVVGDALRQNALAIDKLDVLRIPVLGLRTCPDKFLDQVDAMLRVAGWVPGS